MCQMSEHHQIPKIKGKDKPAESPMNAHCLHYTDYRIKPYQKASSVLEAVIEVYPALHALKPSRRDTMQLSQLVLFDQTLPPTLSHNLACLFLPSLSYKAGESMRRLGFPFSVMFLKNIILFVFLYSSSSSCGRVSCIPQVALNWIHNRV